MTGDLTGRNPVARIPLGTYGPREHGPTLGFFKPEIGVEFGSRSPLRYGRYRYLLDISDDFDSILQVIIFILTVAQK